MRHRRLISKLHAWRTVFIHHETFICLHSKCQNAEQNKNCCLASVSTETKRIRTDGQCHNSIAQDANKQTTRDYLFSVIIIVELLGHLLKQIVPFC